MLNNLIKEHPAGLYLLFFVEMWERFSYYGMRALIVLYMIQTLSFSAQKAGNIYGLYTGLVYLTPIFGGYLADRFLGQRKCISIGAILMSIGLLLLAFASKSLFFVALFLMVLANGFFKSNISSVLGLLYENNTSKKDSAYTIFYMGINIGALLSPLICGTLAIKLGYEYGFAAAGIGMLIGLILYKLLENKLLGNVGIHVKKTLKTDSETTSVTKFQKLRLLALFLLMLFTIPFWICFEQAGSSLTLFAQYNTNRSLFGFVVPTEYFQALNPLFIIILAPILSAFWSYLRVKFREPSSVEKFVLALFLMFIAYVLLAISGYYSEFSKVSIIWLVIVYFIMTVSELCLSPIGLSLVSKLAPKQVLSLIMGCWFLTSFFGNLLAGFWGGKFGTISNYKLFGTLGLLSVLSCLILAIFIPKLNKLIK